MHTGLLRPECDPWLTASDGGETGGAVIRRHRIPLTLSEIGAFHHHRFVREILDAVAGGSRQHQWDRRTMKELTWCDMRDALAALFVVFAPVAFCQEAPDLDHLYQTHQWFAFRDAVQSRAKPADLLRGIVACTFNDVSGCERFMQLVLRSGTSREDKAAAQDRLAILYMSLGRSRLALPHHEAAWKLKAPAASDPDIDGVLLRAYAAFPDISVAAFHACSLPYGRSGGDLAVAVTINGEPGTYTLDTGAGYSSVSESEARRVGMRIQEIAAIPVAGFTGASAPVARVAVADRLELGRIQFRNVPFLVLPDSDSENLLAPRGGALGFQVLVACRTIRWDSSGLVHFGFRSAGRRNTSESNLCFDADSPRAQVEFHGRKLDFKLDTGGTSFLLDRFAEEFPALVRESGHQGTWSSGGFGADQADFAAMLLPEIELKLGPGRCTMHPAPIIRMPGAGGHGLLGLDAFKDTRAVTLDFRNMMLTVE